MKDNGYMELAKKHGSRKKAFSVLGWMMIIIAVLCLIGVIVCAILLGVGNVSESLLLVLILCFFAAVAAFGAFGFLFVTLSSKEELAERDYCERADSEESFFIGEGTLCKFQESALRIQGTSKDKKIKTIFVPYKEIRFFAVCNRRAPKEKGKWSVVMEIPCSYLSPKGKAETENALIETDGKERLYNCIKKRGLALLGEDPQKTEEKHKFERMKKCVLPDTKKRNRALAFLIFGAVIFGAGIAAALLWDTTIGSVAIVIGGYLLLHGATSLNRAKSVFSIYREGIFWKDQSSQDNLFLKWEEIQTISRYERDGLPYLKAECLWGAYEFPCVSGADDFLARNFKDKYQG